MNFPPGGFYRRFAGLEIPGDPLLFGRFHKDRLSSKGYRLEARVRLAAALRGQAMPKRFLILCRARSGSTLLCNLLDQIPGLKCEYEMLHNAVAFPGAYLQALARKSNAKAYGCKLLSYQIVLVQKFQNPRAFFEALVSEDVHLIHLTRDTFEQCVSLLTSQTTRRYHATGGKGVHEQRQVMDPQKFLRLVQWNEALLKLEEDLLAGLPHQKISYETHLKDSTAHQRTVDAICANIGIPSARVEAEYKKMISVSTENFIANYQEIEDVLVSSNLGHMLDMT
jgi:LPS sulfotransferase NodH